MKLKLIFALICMGALASCQDKVRPVPEPEPDHVSTDTTYTCLLPLVEGGKTSWLPGDQILIHGGSSNNQKVITLKAEDIIDDTLCTVSVAGITPLKAQNINVKYIAAYPADRVKNEGECKDMNTFVNPNTLLLSGYDTEENKILFEYIVGGLTFIVDGDYDSYELAGNYEEIVGYESVMCRMTDKVHIRGINQTGEKTTITGSLVSDGSTVNVIYFPHRQPSFQDGFKLHLCKDGKRVKVLDKAGEMDIHLGAFTALGNITDQLVDYKEQDDTVHEPEVLPDYGHLSHISFTESDAVFANPERGFYSTASFKHSTASPLSASRIQAARLEGRTLFYMGYYPKQYMDGDIGEEFLQILRTNMQTLRDNGAKCILRFAYSDGEDEKPWDAKPEIVQRHIKNIKPIIQEYGDVILCFQAGFVGVWGEWYYTDNFVFTPDTPEEHALRKEVVDAMLDALPQDRSVGLRTPMFKRMMYASSYRDTLTLATAYDGSAKARLSGFNDCFGASSTDQGTFDNDATREYWKRDTRYVLMGGETCAVSQYCECEVSLRDMEDYHWTYLNIEYNRKVHNVWKDGGCWDEVERRLGYRLSFADVYHSVPAAGEDFNIVLQIKNTGFAAPMNGRAVELVLVDGNGVKTVYELNDIDPRYWFAGRTVNIDKVIKIPEDAAGKCSLYLNLPDPKPTLHDNPLFSIRLANDGIWEEETGYNKIMEFSL